MDLLKVELDRCTRCGACKNACPSGIINISEKNGPNVRFPKACIACGHCVAVCPEKALDNTRSPLAEQKDIANLEPLGVEDAENFLRFRRSIRVYKNEAVSREKVEQVLNMARLAPSGANSQGVQYLAIDKPETLAKITELTVNWMEAGLEQGTAWLKPYATLVKKYRKTGEDVILRNAPICIVAYGHSKNTMLRDSTCFALAYAELFAPSLGLGSCWAGFLELAMKYGATELIEVLNLPEGMVPSGALMLGLPCYSYRRMVNRNPLDLSWAD